MSPLSPCPGCWQCSTAPSSSHTQRWLRWTEAGKVAQFEDLPKFIDKVRKARGEPATQRLIEDLRKRGVEWLD